MYLILIFTIILILLFFLGILIGKYFYNVSIDKRNVLKKYEEKKIKYKKDKKYKENVDKMWSQNLFLYLEKYNFYNA